MQVGEDDAMNTTDVATKLLRLLVQLMNMARRIKTK
jgi:hypothetical protein